MSGVLHLRDSLNGFLQPFLLPDEGDYLVMPFGDRLDCLHIGLPHFLEPLAVVDDKAVERLNSPEDR